MILLKRRTDMDADNTKQLEDSFGGKAVGLSFNPSGNAQVTDLKEGVAVFINECNDARTEATDPEVKRMYAVAITEAQTAQMWAVKAATWETK
jgi:hypothetical protein